MQQRRDYVNKPTVATDKDQVTLMSTMIQKKFYSIYTQQHKLRTAYSSYDCRGVWVEIY